MGKKLGAALILLWLAQAAAADEAPIYNGGFGAFIAGGHGAAVDNANEYLERTGAKLPGVTPSLGGHGFAVVQEHFIVGARGDAAFVTENGSMMNVKFLNVAAAAEFGYAVANNEYGLAYPFVGAGVSWTSLQLSNNNRVALARYYPAGRQTHNLGPAATVGFSFFHPVRFAGEDDSRGFAAFLGGITGGATFNVGDRVWRDSHGKAVDALGPAAVATFFLQLEVGFGGGTTGL